MSQMPDKAENPDINIHEVVDAYIAKLEAMVNEGRIDTGKLDAIAERAIVQIISRELRNIVDEWIAEEQRDAK